MYPENHSTPAVEDYAKAIYSLTGARAETASTTDLADRLGLTPSSVSAMLRKLGQDGTVEHVPYHGVRLTPKGERIALAVLRRHRLLELFLAETLGVPWDRVHREAEVLEHSLSDELTELMAAKLGNPSVDPHGDPIPTRELDMVEPPTRDLTELEPGEKATFVRVSDSDPEMLGYLSELGVSIGQELVMIGQQPFDGPFEVRAGDRTVALGRNLCRAMRMDGPG
ncbi:MAG: metal-dependent transcriptional regulator [Thermoleophilia bacterium]|nr:metal-dependent transcriptional regulator [Thermoleophilia bacterium]